MRHTRWRKRRYLNEESHGFPVIPMIDVMLNLLIFFMLISRYLAPSLNVSLPQASNAAPQDRPAVAISIDVQGGLMVDGEAARWDELPALLKGKDPDTQVRIGADKTADYDYVVRAMDAAAGAGLTHVALETSEAGVPPLPADGTQP